jgi:hypothetical protein
LKFRSQRSCKSPFSPTKCYLPSNPMEDDKV